jgi:hypothetical protein
MEILVYCHKALRFCEAWSTKEQPELIALDLPSCDPLLLDRNEPGCDDRALRTTASTAGGGRRIRAGRRGGRWTPFGVEQVRVVAGRIDSDRLRAGERGHRSYPGVFVR